MDSIASVYYLFYLAYYLEKERQNLLCGDGSSQSSENEIWRIIWQLKISNAAKMFLWRACHNLVATKNNLLKKRCCEGGALSYLLS